MTFVAEEFELGLKHQPQCKKMMSFAPLTLSLSVILTATSISATSAQAQWFDRENISAWVDVRAHRTDSEEQSWLKRGFGKARYDDDDGVGIGEAALIWQPRLTPVVTAYVQFLYVPDSKATFGINEAFVRYKPVPTSATRFDVRAGRFYPPVSLEHDGGGWTTTRTITPSTGNSWIGEEVLVNGLEATFRHRLETQEIGLTAALFTGNDTAGTLLAFRGFALHDVRSTGSSRLPLPVADTGFAAMFTQQAPYSNPVAEVDNHPGYYVKMFWRAPFPAHMHLIWYDNQADPSVVVKGQYGWATQFADAAIRYNVSSDTQVLAQYMTGKTRMGPVHEGTRHAVEAQFDSAYLMGSHKLSSETTLSLRGDYFEVRDYSNRLADDNTETGHAVTAAVIKRFNERLDVAAEVMTVRSDRPSRITLGVDPVQDQTLVQFNFRFYLQRNEYLN